MTRFEGGMDPDRRIEIPAGFCGIVERNDGALLMMSQASLYVSEDGGLTWGEPSRPSCPQKPPAKKSPLPDYRRGLNGY